LHYHAEITFIEIAISRIRLISFHRELPFSWIFSGMQVAFSYRQLPSLSLIASFHSWIRTFHWYHTPHIHYQYITSTLIVCHFITYSHFLFTFQITPHYAAAEASHDTFLFSIHFQPFSLSMLIFSQPAFAFIDINISLITLFSFYCIYFQSRLPTLIDYFHWHRYLHYTLLLFISLILIIAISTFIFITYYHWEGFRHWLLAFITFS